MLRDFLEDYLGLKSLSDSKDPGALKEVVELVPYLGEALNKDGLKAYILRNVIAG